MIQVGDLVQVRKGSALDCLAFDAEVGLVLESGTFPEEVMSTERVFELLVEWIGRPVALWENPEHLEKYDGA